MKLTFIIALVISVSSCQRKAKCSCTGDTTSETYTIEYENDQPPPIDQCNAIEANSTDNYNCVFRG